MGTAAVFWDRDDTLIADPGYLSDPDQVRLLPGAPEAVLRLAEAGYENIIATNQSGIARGLFDEDTLEKIHERLRSLLAEHGATIDAIYYCPYLNGDEAVLEQYRRDSDLRKPKPGMLVKASLERGIDLVGSWSIGDSFRDAEAGRAAGCRTVLIARDEAGKAEARRHPAVDFVAGSVEEAADIVLRHTRAKGSDANEKSASPTVPGLLQEILQFLRMVDRRAQREDFSLARLAGAVVQILALGALIWAVFGLIQGPPNVTTGDQLVRLLFGILMQLLALTLFVISNRRS